MDKLIQLISTLAWPLTVTFIVLLFRHEFKQAARRLSSLSFKDIKADFSNDLNQIEGDISQLPHQTQESAPLQSEDNESENTYETHLRIARISPRAAIMEAWREIEITSKKVVEAYGISVGGRIAGVKAIRQIVDKGLMPQGVISIYERMRRLRSRAAHAHDFDIDPEEAERYIETANEFHDSLLYLLKNAK